MMTTVVDDAKTILRTVLRENDDTVWIVQRKASRTGDKRLIAFFRVTAERTIAPITREVAIVMGKPYDQTNQGIWLWKGEDAIRLVVGPLSRILFDHSLALDAEWL